MADDINSEIRQSLVQFIGALLSNSSFKGAQGRQVVCAALTEEALKLVTVNDKIETYSAKPLLRAAVLILQDKKKEYEDMLGDNEHRKQILAILRELRAAIKMISVIVDSTKEAPSSGS